MSARADIQAGRAFVSLYVKQEDLKRGLSSARQNLNEFGSSLIGIGAKVAGVGSSLLATLAAPIKFASDFEESFSKFGFIFGEATEATKRWGDEFANQVGRSRLQITNFLGDSQALFIPIGFEPGAATDMSKQITQLAVDLASFYNKADTDTFRDLQSALVGSSETMLKYGVIANEAAVKAELLNMAIDPKAATNQEKVLARYNIIMRDTAAAQGDATRTADGAANSWKALKATLTDAAVEIGTAILPVVAKLTQVVTDFIKPISELIVQNRGLVGTFAAAAISATAAGVAIMGVGIAAKASAAVAGVVGTAYRVAATVASAAWYAVGIVFTVLQTKAILAGKVLTAAWLVASTAISAGFKVAAATISAAMTGASWIATAALIATAWGAAAIAIAASYFGLGTVLAAVALAASGAWSVAAGVVGAAWGALTGMFAAAGLSGSLSAAISSAAWTAYGAVMSAVAAKGSIEAAILSLAWTGAAFAASTAWTAFGAVLAAVLTPANLLAVAGFAVSAAWSVAWAAISGPVLPFVVAIGAAVAAVTAIGVAAGIAAVRNVDLSSAISGVKTQLLSVMDSARRLGDVLISSISAGEYALAWQAAIEGAKLAIAEGLISMRNSFLVFFAEVWGMAKKFFTEFVRLSLTAVERVARAVSSPIGAAWEGKKLMDDIRGMNLDLGINIDPDAMRKDALAKIDELQAELDRRAADRKAKEEADAIRNEDPAKIAADRKAKIDELEKTGELSPEEADAARKRAKAEGLETSNIADTFDRETQAIQEQIIAMRDGEEAAERFRLSKQGLSEDQINQVMQLRKEREELEKAKEAETAKMKAEQDRIAKAMRWDPVYADPKMDNETTSQLSKPALASAATTSVASLIAAGRGDSGVIAETTKVRNAIEKAEQKRAIDAALTMEKLTALGQWHA